MSSPPFPISAALSLGFPLPPCISHIPSSQSQMQPSPVQLCTGHQQEGAKKNTLPSTEPLFSAFPACLS